MLCVDMLPFKRDARKFQVFFESRFGHDLQALCQWVSWSDAPLVDKPLFDTPTHPNGAPHLSPDHGVLGTAGRCFLKKLTDKQTLLDSFWAGNGTRGPPHFAIGSWCHRTWQVLAMVVFALCNCHTSLEQTERAGSMSRYPIDAWKSVFQWKGIT